MADDAFEVDFDYREPATRIYHTHAAASAALAEYASLPRVALGHSLGALMQVLLTCSHRDYAEACSGVALVSYNNKPASEAIPFFEQVFVPANGRIGSDPNLGILLREDGIKEVTHAVKCLEFKGSVMLACSFVDLSNRECVVSRKLTVDFWAG